MKEHPTLPSAQKLYFSKKKKKICFSRMGIMTWFKGPKARKQGMPSKRE
jgi:hypothetical protein